MMTLCQVKVYELEIHINPLVKHLGHLGARLQLLRIWECTTFLPYRMMSYDWIRQSQPQHPPGNCCYKGTSATHTTSAPNQSSLKQAVPQPWNDQMRQSTRHQILEPIDVLNLSPPWLLVNSITYLQVAEFHRVDRVSMVLLGQCWTVANCFGSHVLW